MSGLSQCGPSEKPWTRLDTTTFLSLSELEQVLSERLFSSAKWCVFLKIPSNLRKAHADGGNFVIVLPPAYFMSLMTEEALLDYFRSVNLFLKESLTFG